MAAEVTWESTTAGGAPSTVTEHGRVVIHLGQLFIAGVRRYNLRSHLLTAPAALEGSEVRIELSGGISGRIRFEGGRPCDAALLCERLQDVWERHGAKTGTDAGTSGVVDLTQSAAEPVVDFPIAATLELDANFIQTSARSRSPRGSQPSTSTLPPRRLLRRYTPILDAPCGDVTTPRRQLRRACTDTGVYMPARRHDASLRRALRAASSAESPVRVLRRCASNPTGFTASPQAKEETEEEKEKRRLRQLGRQASQDMRSPAKQSLSRPIESSEASTKEANVNVCIVCHDAMRQVVFIPCKHLVCCGTCGKEPRQYEEGLRTCPVCRAEIDWRFNVYL